MARAVNDEILARLQSLICQARVMRDIGLACNVGRMYLDEGPTTGAVATAVGQASSELTARERADVFLSQLGASLSDMTGSRDEDDKDVASARWLRDPTRTWKWVHLSDGACAMQVRTVAGGFWDTPCRLRQLVSVAAFAFVRLLGTDDVGACAAHIASHLACEDPRRAAVGTARRCWSAEPDREHVRLFGRRRASIFFLERDHRALIGEGGDGDARGCSGMTAKSAAAVVVVVDRPLAPDGSETPLSPSSDCDALLRASALDPRERGFVPLATCLPRLASESFASGLFVTDARWQ